jgi:hypothetical protein
VWPVIVVGALLVIWFAVGAIRVAMQPRSPTPLERQIGQCTSAVEAQGGNADVCLGGLPSPSPDADVGAMRCRRRTAAA